MRWGSDDHPLSCPNWGEHRSGGAERPSRGARSKRVRGGSLRGDPNDHFVERNGLRYAGSHLIIDLWDGEHLDDVGVIELALRRAAQGGRRDPAASAPARVRTGGGVSGVAVLAESHISIHTWPERGYAAIDAFMCGSAEPHKVVPVLRHMFKARRIDRLRADARRAVMSRVVRGSLHSTLAPAVRSRTVRHRGAPRTRRRLSSRRLLLGRVFVLDGFVQITESDEFIYHEMISHVAIVAHGAARDILIIGGGDGGTLEEVLKHGGMARRPWSSSTPAWSSSRGPIFLDVSRGAFDDPRTELIFSDGVRFVAETDRRFDVIIVDSTDPSGRVRSLFTEAFYADCRSRLRPGGVLVAQSGNPFVEQARLRACLAAARQGV